MERMFPEPKEFIYVPHFVVLDSKSPYKRYVCLEKGKYTGLLEATRFTEEELKNYTLKENEISLNYEDAIKLR